MRKRTPVAERFWAKVDKTSDPNGCWLWIAAPNTDGYGRFWVSAEQPHVVAHRFAYELLMMPIPDGLVIDHLCRTPLCVNPAHLEPVTVAENTRRGISAQVTRERLLRTQCPKGHPYEGDNLVIRPCGRRACRTCRRMWAARWSKAHPGRPRKKAS